jgi:hypothetical protein
MLDQDYLQPRAPCSLVEEKLDVLSHGHHVIVFAAPSDFSFVTFLVLGFRGEIGATDLVEDQYTGYWRFGFLEMLL